MEKAKGHQSHGQLWRWVFTITQSEGEDEKAFTCKFAEIRTKLQLLAKKWVFQLERGKNGAKLLHYQGRLSLNNKTIKKTLLNQLEPNKELQKYVYLRGENDEDASNFYCTKSDTRVRGPWADRAIYEGHDCQIVTHERHTWQQQLIDIISNEDPGRAIIFVVDPKGNCGKSTFQKYLVYTGLANFLIANTSPDQLISLVINTKPATCYVLDFARAAGFDLNDKEVATALECIKNGMLQSHKWKGQQELRAPCHVICFVNEVPRKGLWTDDRVRVMYLQPHTRTLEEVYGDNRYKDGILPTPKEGPMNVFDCTKKLEVIDLTVEDEPEEPELQKETSTKTVDTVLIEDDDDVIELPQIDITVPPYEEDDLAQYLKEAAEKDPWEDYPIEHTDHDHMTEEEVRRMDAERELVCETPELVIPGTPDLDLPNPKRIRFD